MQELIGNILPLYVLQIADGDGFAEVKLHEVKYGVDMVLQFAGYDFADFYDGGVVDLEEVVQLAIGSFGISQVLKGVFYFFDCHWGVGPPVDCLEDLAVRALADLAYHFISFVYVILQLLFHI